MDERTVRALARIAVALCVITGAVLSEAALPVIVAAVAVALASTLVLPGQGWGVLAGALVIAGAVAVLCDGEPANVGWFALCLLAGYCALRGGARQAISFGTAAVLVFALQVIVRSSESGWAAWFGGTLFSTVICLMARRQGQLLDQLRAAQAGIADRIRAEERNRVARELHDVIGHSLTVSLLHISSARLAIEHDLVQAGEQLAQAERLGRQSLTEVRHAVGLLRDGSGGRAPLPGAAQLSDLVDGFRRAGTNVAYEVVGDPARLTATTGLTVYRILQESLTNAVRHGTSGGAAVRLEVSDRSAVLTVDTVGTVEMPSSPGAVTGGSGLAGMRERAQALGGELTAGPSGSGWRVRTVLPA